MNNIQIASKKLEELNEVHLRAVLNIIDTFLEVQNTPNDETLEAMEEVEEMERNPHLYKSYSCFDEILEEVQNEI